MRSAGAILPSTTSSVAGPSSRSSGGGGIRASDRRSRRDKARKSSLYGGGRGFDDGGAGSSSSVLLQENEYRVAIHMDLLEGVNENVVSIDDNDDDEYDEFAELDDDGTGSKKKRRRKGSANPAVGKSLSKYLRPRSLASILLEEAGRSDSMAKQYVDAAVRRLSLALESDRPVHYGGRTGDIQSIAPRQCVNMQSFASNNTITTTITKPYPPRKFCPVTGLFGVYTEPKTGIPYATLSALEQIRERAPPWMTMSSGGSASYWEAVKSLQNDS